MPPPIQADRYAGQKFSDDAHGNLNFPGFINIPAQHQSQNRADDGRNHFDYPQNCTFQHPQYTYIFDMAIVPPKGLEL